MAAAAAIVLIAGAALVAPSLMPSGDGRVGNASAAELLHQAATTTGDARLQPGQYLYVLQYTRRSSSNDEHTWMYLQDQDFQTWIPADRTREWLYRRTVTGPKQWLIGSEKDLPPDAPRSPAVGEWKADERKANGGRFFGTDPDQVNFRNPTPDYLVALPRDPKALYDKLVTEAAGDQGSKLLQMVTDGLDTGRYPADVRATVFTALTSLPKLKVVDRTAVLDSRRGTALGVTENGITEQIVIDPATGDYLGSRSVLAGPWHGLKAGQVLDISSLTTRVVSGMGAPY